MSSQDKNLPYEILTLSHLGFKYCSVRWYDGILNFLSICQPKEAHFTAELYFDLVDILVKKLSSVVQL